MHMKKDMISLEGSVDNACIGMLVHSKQRVDSREFPRFSVEPN